MNAFHAQNGTLWCGKTDLNALATEGTPTYVYSAAKIRDQYAKLAEAVEGLNALICYAVKANSFPPVLELMNSLGAGADVVSIGEYRLARAAGVAPDKIVFAGVGKQRHEMREALEGGLLQFNVESEAELKVLNQVAADLGKIAPIALRLNPDVDAKTHAKITTGKAENKFGISLDDARSLIKRMGEFPHINLQSVAVHIGSQLTDPAPYREAYAKMAAMARFAAEAGRPLKRIDVGGGLGVIYDGETAFDLKTYREILRETVVPLGLPLVFEPGRFLVAEAGGLLTRVIYVKEGPSKRFLIVDAAMNDLIRPTLYDAHHPILTAKEGRSSGEKPADVVGPVCETGDALALGRDLPKLEADDLLLIGSAGAYCAVMASTYNARALPREVLV